MRAVYLFAVCILVCVGMDTPKDPLYGDQWHLPMIKAPEAWEITRGEGTVVQIIDDGLQHSHPELQVQYRADLSTNFNDGVPLDPTPNVGKDFHGTSCGGVATGRDNSVCGVGSAYRAGVAGVRLIGGPTDDATEAEGLVYGKEGVSVMSCSWGPTDDGRRLQGPGSVAKMAMREALETGRGGRGSVWVWAAGNGGHNQDDCNYDGYANSPFTVAIGAVTDGAIQAYYSEPCAALVAVAPSSGGQKGITTCDLLGRYGYSPNDCTNMFGGTSSAAPLASGVVALMLSVNPRLGWKDVQVVLMESSVMVDPLDADWQRNGAGRWVSHKYGYGLIDALAAVKASLNYSSYLSVVPSAVVVEASPLLAIPQHTPSRPFAEAALTVSMATTVEHVQVVFTSDHPDATELDIRLTSPRGTHSQLARLRSFARSGKLVLGPPHTASFDAKISDFGPVNDRHSITAALSMVKSDACVPESIVNGTIAVVKRGGCPFSRKVLNLQNAGAVAVVVYSLSGQPVAMTGDGRGITVPSFMISLDAFHQLQSLAPSQATFVLDVTKVPVSLRYSDWAFTSLRHWGEDGNGVWTLRVTDGYQQDGSTLSQGRFVSWKLLVYTNDPTLALSKTSSYDLRFIVAAAVGFALCFVGTAIFYFVQHRKKRNREMRAAQHLEEASTDAPVQLDSSFPNTEDTELNEDDDFL